MVRAPRRRILTSEAAVRRYHRDPAAYAREVLGVRWWHKQVEIANALVAYKRVFVKASHSVGKSFLAGGLVNWFFDSFDPGICITTAPNAPQVRDILWKEVRIQRPLALRAVLQPKAPRMESSPNHFAAGFTARDGSGFQGRHEEHVLIVFDECVGVAAPFWDAAEGMMTGEECYFLALCNPTDTGSRAFLECGNTTKWHVIEISALEHPNIAADLAGLPAPFPKAVRLQWIEGRIAEWCIALPADEAVAAGNETEDDRLPNRYDAPTGTVEIPVSFEPNDGRTEALHAGPVGHIAYLPGLLPNVAADGGVVALYAGPALGGDEGAAALYARQAGDIEYPAGSRPNVVNDGRLDGVSGRLVGSLEFPPGSGRWYQPGPLFESRVLGLWPTRGATSVWSEALWAAAQAARVLDPGETLAIGCDVARFGDDFTSIVVRRGSCVLHHETHNGWDTTQTTGRLKQLATHYARSGEEARSATVFVDDDGVGGGVTDQAGDYDFTPVSGASRALEANGYPNRRSELWFATAERAAEGRLDLSRLSRDALALLQRQVMAPTWRIDNQGRRVVEAKAETKRRIGRSPDDADALNLAFTIAPRLETDADLYTAFWARDEENERP